MFFIKQIIGGLVKIFNSTVSVNNNYAKTNFKGVAVTPEVSKQIQNVIVNKNSKEPTVSEISLELNIPKEEIVYALEAIQEPVSLFEPAYNDGTDTLFVMDQVKDTKNTDESWLEEIALKEAMKRLSEREKRIITLRFFAGKTQMEVAEQIGISQAQVSRLEKGALQRMKKFV